MSKLKVSKEIVMLHAKNHPDSVEIIGTIDKFFPGLLISDGNERFANFGDILLRKGHVNNTYTIVKHNGIVVVRNLTYDKVWKQTSKNKYPYSKLTDHKMRWVTRNEFNDIIQGTGSKIDDFRAITPQQINSAFEPTSVGAIPVRKYPRVRIKEVSKDNIYWYARFPECYIQVTESVESDMNKEHFPDLYTFTEVYTVITGEHINKFIPKEFTI